MYKCVENLYSKFKEVTYLIYNFVFDQVFFISTILIAFVINSFFATEVSNLLGPIKFLVKDRVYSTTIVIVWGLICFIKNALDFKSKKIDELNQIIKNKDRQIEINSGILEGKYGEFAEAIYKDNISKVLNKAVKKFPLVEACHLYSYEYNRSKNNVDVKLNFLDGCEQEGVCINVLKQKYYSIDKDIFNKLEKLINENNDMELETFTSNIKNLIKCIDVSKINESVKYRLKQIVFGIICTRYADSESNIGLKEKSENQNKDNFRTGILGAILSPQKGYIYSYEGNKETKSGRIYYSTAIFLNEEYILNISIDGRGMNGKELDDFFKTVVNMIKDEYNYIIGGRCS